MTAASAYQDSPCPCPLRSENMVSTNSPAHTKTGQPYSPRRQESSAAGLLTRALTASGGEHIVLTVVNCFRRVCSMSEVDDNPLSSRAGLRDTTQAVQDYLKAIYKLQQRARPVSTVLIAERLGLSSAAVSKMLKHLAALRLVEHRRYQGVELTPPGEKIALEVIRHHRLLELYLVEALGVPWDRVDAEAEVLEHVLSEEVEERIAMLLGHPTHDPHGDPIPGHDGVLDERAGRRLAEVPTGTRARVLRVPDRDPQLLRYLGELGLVPQAEVRVVRREPLEGPLHVQLSGAQATYVLGRDIAEQITVSW